MNDRLRELVELSEAVDVICKEVKKSNEEKKLILKGNLEVRWNQMWEDLNDLLIACQNLKYPGCHHLKKVSFGYPYGYNALHDWGVTLIYNSGFCPKVMIDNREGWREATWKGDRYGFSYWYRCEPKVLEMLLDNWPRVYSELENTVAEELAKSIRDQAEAARKETEELNRKLNA